MSEYGKDKGIVGRKVMEAERVVRQRLSRTESATLHIQRIPSPSPPKAAPKLKYSHVVGSTLRPRDPGKLSPDLSHVRSRDISTTLGSRDIQACDPGKVSHDLPRDWSSTRSQVTTRSPDRVRFRRAPSPLIGMWKTMGTINKSTNQQTTTRPWSAVRSLTRYLYLYLP